jgi:hypothetical protein
LKRATSQFYPESGVRGFVPKDVWFAVYNARNRDEFIGMPQVFMIVSERGIEYGFAASIHPNDFSTPAVQQRVRTAMPKIFAALPSSASPEANALSTSLDRSGGWFFQRKTRLLPGVEAYRSLDDWLSFLKSSTGSGGSISRYLTEDDLQRSDLDLTALLLETAEIFSSVMVRVTPIPVVTKTVRRSVQTSFEEFLSTFPDVRSQKTFGEHDELKKILNLIRSGLEDLPALRAHPHIRVSWSLGAGNWARVPWIALMDEQETTSTQRGTYCVFLFREDMSGVYLTLNQGVTETIDKHGRLEGRKVLRQQAQAIRSIVGAQISSRFKLDDGIDLRTEGGLGQDYEASTVGYSLYSKGAFPSDSELNDDLTILLAAYAKVLTRETPPSSPPVPEPSGPALQPTYTIDDFVRESRLSNDRIKRWQTSLLRKQQIILQGPPGTGKTFVAERLARLLVSDTAGFWDIVQFHPSYAYEDFMQGIRPSVEGGALSYSIEPGRFLQFCKRAEDTDAPAVLIIDEINRGNLSRVFGELMYLLEYRDKEVPLASGGSTFRIPKNVYLIGTMNTADRSIALVDHALRRRFSFIYLEPDYDVLESHLSEHGLPVDSLIKTLKALNAAIDDRHYSVGISFFLTDGRQLRSTLEEIWRGEIEPYLEEYFYDQPDKAKVFRWEALVTKELADWV